MGDAFEHAVLHYLRHDPVVGFRQAWLWDDWPERISLGLKSDQGVDIVAVDGEGKRVAVQVKFHSDPARSVTQGEVATLFSFRSDLFERWVIVSNAVGRSANAVKATAGRGDVTWVHRDALVDSTIDWTGALEAVSGRARPTVARKEPTRARPDRRHRRHAQGPRGARAGPAHHGLRHRQDARHPLDHRGPQGPARPRARAHAAAAEAVPHPVARAGRATTSSTSASAPMPTRWVQDEWTVHPDELGVRVTTDPADIAVFLKGKGRRVVFGTYASSARIAEAQEDPSVPAFDLVVADEAHRVAGITSRGNAKKRDTKVVLDGDRIRAKRRLFATATPRVYTKSSRTWLEGLRGCRVRLDGRCRALRRRGPPALVPSSRRTGSARGLPPLGRGRHRCRGRAARPRPRRRRCPGPHLRCRDAGLAHRGATLPSVVWINPPKEVPPQWFCDWVSHRAWQVQGGGDRGSQRRLDVQGCDTCVPGEVSCLRFGVLAIELGNRRSLVPWRRARTETKSDARSEREVWRP